MVYILKANNIYKIGITKNKVSNTVKGLQTGCPFKIEIFDTFETRNDLAVETALHKIFRNKGTYGEWFELSNEDIEKLYSTIDYIQSFTKENDNIFLFTKILIILFFKISLFKSLFILLNQILLLSYHLGCKRFSRSTYKSIFF